MTWQRTTIDFAMLVQINDSQSEIAMNIAHSAFLGHRLGFDEIHIEMCSHRPAVQAPCLPSTSSNVRFFVCPHELVRSLAQKLCRSAVRLASAIAPAIHMRPSMQRNEV